MGKTDNRRRLRQGLGLLTAALIGGTLAVLAVVVTLAAPQHSFLHIPTNLSQSQELQSYFTDIAVSPDGDQVAVVWPEAHAGGGKPRGSVELRWASESTGSGWNENQVFDGSSNKCAIESVVAVTGTTAHVAYIAQSSCDTPSDQWLYYRTCPLGGGNCNAPQTITSTSLSGSSDPGLAGVDIALDNQGTPHFAYVYYHWDDVITDDVGSVYYYHGSEERVSGDNQDCNNPALAWSNGYVHTVWEDERNFTIWYRRRGSSTWGDRQEVYPSASEDYPPRNPDVAAHGSEVIVTFDMGWLDTGDFVVAYRRNTSNGDPFDWSAMREVGTDLNLGSVNPLYKYDSTLSEDPYEYLLHLRPTLALDGEGLPTVVWHADDGVGGDMDYNLYYTQGISKNFNNINWTTPTHLYQSVADQAGGVVGLASVASPTLHVAYLQLWENEDPESDEHDWDTYYTSSEEESAGYPSIFLPLVLRRFANDPGGGGG